MTEEAAPQKNFAIQKLYVKDVSFESPETPHIFNFQKWEPKIDLNLNNSHNKLENDAWEIVLTLTITVKHDDKTAYLVEIQQAGVFIMSGVNDQERGYLVGSQCMNILFPYAREAVSDLTVRGGFPPLVLTPVNFDALYQQHLQQQQGKNEEVKH